MIIGRDSITLDQALVALRENDRFMVRREGEEKKSVGDGLYSEGSNRGRTKDKGYQEKEKSQGRGDLSDKECYYGKKKGHIQIMCKDVREDLKRMNSLRDRGRKESENSGNAALGFVTNDDDDYDGALVVDGGMVNSKERVIDSGCSFHICCEREKFSKLRMSDKGLINLPNDEKVKVEGMER